MESSPRVKDFYVSFLERLGELVSYFKDEYKNIQAFVTITLNHR